jgi:hypothetical protein
MQCPKCKSRKIFRSRSRGLEKINRILFFRRYYRCHECGWRGSRFKKTKVPWEKVILIIVYFAALAFIVRTCVVIKPEAVKGEFDPNQGGRP